MKTKQKRRTISKQKKEGIYSYHTRHKLSQKQTAELFGVYPSTVGDILRKRQLKEAINNGFMGCPIHNTEMEYGFESFRELYIHQKGETVGNLKKI